MFSLLQPVNVVKFRNMPVPGLESSDHIMRKIKAGRNVWADIVSFYCDWAISKFGHKNVSSLYPHLLTIIAEKAPDMVDKSAVNPTVSPVTAINLCLKARSIITKLFIFFRVSSATASAFTSGIIGPA